VAAVANDQAYVHGMLQKIVNLIEREPRVQLIGFETELV
jgi:uncharacterized protein YlxP (DUF503 family)